MADVDNLLRIGNLRRQLPLPGKSGQLGQNGDLRSALYVQIGVGVVGAAYAYVIIRKSCISSRCGSQNIVIGLIAKVPVSADKQA